MKKPQKANNTTTKKEAPPKIAYDQYFDFLDFREKPASENFIMRLGQEFIDWSFNSKGTKASQFFKAKGVDSRTYYRWMEKYPKFEQAYYFALEVLGDKREQGAIERKFDPNMIKHRMHAYDPEWVKSDTYHSKLKEDANAISPEEAQKIVQNVLQDFNKKDK